SKENRNSLLVTRRIAATQFAHDFGVREPRRNITPFVQTIAQLGSGDVEHACTLRYLVVRNIDVLILQINHHIERNHGDADVLLMFPKDFLRIIGPVKRLAVRVLAWAGMIATDNKMRYPVVLSNEGMPDRFTRSAHAHCERQQ